MKIDSTFKSLYEMLTKKLPGEEFIPNRIIYMLRNLYKEFHKKAFNIFPDEDPLNSDVETMEDGGVIMGTNIRVYDI